MHQWEVRIKIQITFIFHDSPSSHSITELVDGTTVKPVNKGNSNVDSKINLTKK